MQSPDHPELVFVQARYYGRGRPSGAPRWIVAHTMEAGESSTRAENTAAYFANPGDGRVVSSHYCADDNSIVACVKLADVAYTVGNIGNQLGINWEFSGFAGQTAAQWGDAFSMAMLQRAAPYWKADAAKYGIPLRWCSIADLRARRGGFTTHNDLRIAYGGTTHTDPGVNFPRAAFLKMITGGDDDMTPAELLTFITKQPLGWGSQAMRDRQVAAGWPAAGLTCRQYWSYAFEGSTNTAKMLTAMAPKLEEILAAAQDDGNVDVILDAASLAALNEIKVAIAQVPELTADELREIFADASTDDTPDS